MFNDAALSEATVTPLGAVLGPDEVLRTWVAEVMTAAPPRRQAHRSLTAFAACLGVSNVGHALASRLAARAPT